MGFDIGLIINFFNKGGVFMYPILMISIIALTIILMKWWTLRTKSIIPKVFTGDLYSLISQGRLEEATGLSMREDSSIARIALAALSGNHKDREELRENIEEAGRRESHELSRYLEGLGAISNVSTLLGLLGTISGMIKIFDVIATEIIVNQQNLAGGISEALYTTAFGLSVAIPVFLAYKFFSGKVDDYISELELEGRKIMEDVLATRDLTPLSPDEAPSGITL